MASIIRGSDNFDSALANGLKAWLNFNGTGTPAIRAASNVSSITDNGTGDYTINFANPMADANYASPITGGDVAAGNGVAYGTTTKLAGSLRVFCRSISSLAADPAELNVAIFR
jgi:hypothetical protein